jgi:hypothetical protein
MLCEALGTCLGADQLIVTDDGSDFDVTELVTGCRPDAEFVINSKMTVAERLKTARVGNLINRALSLVRCDVVTYLCDDDLFHPHWLPAVRAYFGAYPGEHWCRGAWFAWDEDNPAATQTRCKLDARQLTTGNFAHRAVCFHKERIAWDETTIASHDNAFLLNAQRVHDMRRVPFVGAVAGWRRLHKHNALPYAAADGYTKDGAALFANTFLE